MQVIEIPLSIAKPFIELWHYSKVVPKGKNVFFGWYIEDELYAVANYGIGINQVQEKYLAKVVQREVTKTNLYELKRLCRTDPRKDAYPLSKFLSICHKLLKRKGIAYIVSFSDPHYNAFKEQRAPYSSGGIYKAANFAYLGKTNSELHVIDQAGIIRHRRYAYRYMQRQHQMGNIISLEQARAILNVTPFKTQPKDRWFLEI